MPWETDQASADASYRPSSAARLNYLDYLLSEPRMDEVLKAAAALEEGQRRVLVAFLQRMSPGDRLTLDRRRHMLVRGGSA